MRIPSEHKIPGRFAPIFLWKKEDNYVKIKNKELYMCNICARCSKTMLVFWEILLSLSARRVWIEICIPIIPMIPVVSHSPRGGCGLKSASYVAYDCLYKSLSARRVWIEIGTGQAQRSVIASLSARRVWIEIIPIRCNT